MPNLIVGEKHLHSLFKKGQLLQYQKDEMILTSTDAVPHLFWVESGFVRVFTITPSGDKNIFVIYKTQEFFPWWILKQSGHTDIGLFYEAKTRVSIRRLTKSALLDEMTQDPHLAYAVTQQMLRVLEMYGTHIKSQGFRHVRERVRYYLMVLGARFGRYRKESGEIFIDAPITHQDIASSLGTTRETVTREMQTLIHEQLIDQQGHFIIIKNYKRLKDEFDE
jgi:CRP/FNR family transcriptional regulator, cyclic AMP receptor protein